MREPPPWDEIWKSLGTKLSDATEECAWRKLLHRGTFVRNRDRTATDQTCRLKCGQVESMYHLVKCRYANTYWDRVFQFIKKVIGDPDPDFRDRAIILNMWTRTEMGSEAACAFIRHAYGCYYRDIALVDTLDKPFVPVLTFNRAVTNFANAVRRYGQNIKRFHARRKYTKKQSELPREAIEKFNTLLTIRPSDYNFDLTPQLKHAIKAADRDATEYVERHMRPQQRAAAP